MAKKVESAETKISNMHSKIQSLRMERNAAVAKMQAFLSGNASQLDSKVKEVSARLDSEFAQTQQQMDALHAEVTALQDKNRCLVEENAKLQNDNQSAAARISSMMEDFKEKKVTFSATVPPPAANAADKGTKSFSPASSFTSGSCYIDPEVAARVSRALESARNRKSKNDE